MRLVSAYTEIDPYIADLRGDVIVDCLNLLVIVDNLDQFLGLVLI